MRPFALTIHMFGPFGQQPPPAAGEEVGQQLANLADSFSQRADVSRTSAEAKDNFHKAAIFFHLAADSYDLAANASIGHKRTARYEEARDLLRKKAHLIDEKV